MSYQSILLQHLFDRPDIKAVTGEQLTRLTRKYPYFAHARWFKALKENENGSGDHITSKAAAEAALYTFQPLRLAQFLSLSSRENAAPDTVEEPVAESGQDQNVPRREPSPAASPEPKTADSAEPARIEETNETNNGTYAQAPLIQPLFTRDYFAFTGQELPDQIENDKRPTMEQLHSFTGWLRTLKRTQGATDPDLKADEASLAARSESEDAGIKKSAEASLKVDEDVLTEAMAEVRVSKGQIDKALDIYQKLSLSNPEKSAYFAQKIADLKNK